MPPRPSADEAAAIAAAIQRFEAEMAPAGNAAQSGLGPWQRAALLDGIGGKKPFGRLDGEGGDKWLS